MYEGGVEEIEAEYAQEQEEQQERRNQQQHQLNQLNQRVFGPDDDNEMRRGRGRRGAKRKDSINQAGRG